MAINPRAIASAPVYEIRNDKHVIILDTYNWCAHPAFGSSISEYEFDSEVEALDFMERVAGYVVRR